MTRATYARLILFGLLSISGCQTHSVARPLSERERVIARINLVVTRLKDSADPKKPFFLKPNMAVALALSESGLKMVNTLGKDGECYGVFQVSKRTAEDFLPSGCLDAITDDEGVNIAVGCAIFNYELSLWHGNEDRAILGYKVGNGRLRYLIRHGLLKQPRYQKLCAIVHGYEKLLVQ